MGRLQDYNTVTPAATDNLLIVQSTGQGLAPVGSTLGAKMDKVNPTGTGALSINRKAGTTSGQYSSTENYNGEASGNYAHAEGSGTTARGDTSHAEGYVTVASGAMAHAEGNITTASGTQAHAEGYHTTASGGQSHAEGRDTIANHRSQHTLGEFNIADTSTEPEGNKGNYIEIVGNGSNDANRSNARTLDWSGNEVLAGGLKINGNQNVVADATGEITISQLIAAGYITGSGNYVDFCYYLPTKENATITFNSLDNSVTTIFTPTTRLNNVIDTTNVSITRVNRYCLKIELKFTSTQTPLVPCTILVSNLKITIT